MSPITLPVYVAYADDHKLVRTTVIEFLNRLGGIEVILEAANGEELLRKMEDTPFLPHVCIIDIVMPKMNGFETVASLRYKWPEVKILVLSGYLSEEYLIKMLLAGAHGYLTKGESPEEMKKAVMDLHTYGLYNSELFTPQFIADVRQKRLQIPELTPTEVQLLKLSIEDMTYDEIASVMNLSKKSVEGHRSRLFTKLRVRTRAGLALYAVRFGYVSIESGIQPNSSFFNP